MVSSGPHFGRVVVAKIEVGVHRPVIQENVRARDKYPVINRLGLVRLASGLGNGDSGESHPTSSSYVHSVSFYSHSTTAGIQRGPVNGYLLPHSPGPDNIIAHFSSPINAPPGASHYSISTQYSVTIEWKRGSTVRDLRNLPQMPGFWV